MTPPVEATTHIPVTLEAQQWNVILGALADTPWRQANPIIIAIRAQCDAFSGGLTRPLPMPLPANGEEQSRGL